MNAPAPGNRAQGVVRRWVVYAILFTLVALAANGVSGLLHRLIDVDAELGGGTYGLALSLAYTLIAGPLAVLLWWFSWRRMSAADRGSIAWGLYVAAMYTVALIVFSISLLEVLAGAVEGDWEPASLASAVAWFAVWLAHRFLLRHPEKGPIRLATVPLVLGVLWGLVVAAVAGVQTLTGLFDEAVTVGLTFGTPWWTSALQALIWCVGGLIIWSWHWHRERVWVVRGGFAEVVIVVIVLGAALAALGGIGTVLFVALRTIADRSAGWADILDPLPTAVAAAGVGLVVWTYHRRTSAVRTAAAIRLVESGVGLAGLASGVGVIINALLAALRAPLAGTSALELLLGGLSALIVGAVVWAWAWRPLRTDEAAGDPARRIYLVAIFAVSAVVALGALLIIAFRIIEAVLGEDGDVIERTRAPLGLLVATALVAGYHFAIWRRDRALVPAVAAPARAIDQVVLVTSDQSDSAAAAVRAATGADVLAWTRTDIASPVSAGAVAEALAGVASRRVLVVTGPDSRIEVIPLAD